MTFEPLQPRTDFVPLPELLIEDLETLKVMADPLRLRLRELMGKPCTVKQIARLLDIPATKLYYHVNLLEKHGLIVVVDAKVVSGIIEKHYQVAARSLRVAAHLLSSPLDSQESLNISINTVFEDARNNLFESIRAGVVDLSESAPDHVGAKIASLRLRLNDTEARDLFGQLETLLNSFTQASHVHQAADATDTHVYKLFVTAFPSSRADQPPE